MENVGMCFHSTSGVVIQSALMSYSPVINTVSRPNHGYAAANATAEFDSFIVAAMLG